MQFLIYFGVEQYKVSLTGDKLLLFITSALVFDVSLEVRSDSGQLNNTVD